MEWMKLDANFFENDKIKIIKKMRDGEKIILFFLKLLTNSAKNDRGGAFLIGEKPMTETMIAVAVDEPEKLVVSALKTFEDFGMIIRENGVITLKNWCIWQTDAYDKKREQARERMRKMRNTERNKCVTDCVTDSVTDSVTPSVTERNKCVTVTHTEKKREDKNINIYMSSPLTPPLRNTERNIPAAADRVVELWRDLCPSFAGVVGMSDKRRDALNGLIETYNGEDIRKAFEKVERSEFLKGRNERGWKADFDWVIRKDNFPKILEGKYDDYEKLPADGQENSTFDTDEFFETALKKSYGGKT